MYVSVRSYFLDVVCLGVWGSLASGSAGNSSGSMENLAPVQAQAFTYSTASSYPDSSA
jgi:hypothetical protein